MSIEQQVECKEESRILTIFVEPLLHNNKSLEMGNHSILIFY